MSIKSMISSGLKEAAKGGCFAAGEMTYYSVIKPGVKKAAKSLKNKKKGDNA